MKRCAVLTLLVALTLIPCVASNESVHLVDLEMAELVSEMADLLDQALYLAIAALSWPDVDDLTLYIQGVINLLDGPSSPEYDSSCGATTPKGDGLKDLHLALQTSGLTTTEAEPFQFRASVIIQVAQAMEHLERFLFMASEAAKGALDRVYSVTGGREELRAMYAYLLAARGRAGDELVLGGMSALEEVFPSLDLRVEPSGSLQATIDRAPAGATIHLDPGTYRERVVIDKDLTLIGASVPSAEFDSPATIIAGSAWEFIVSVEGDDVKVRLVDLAVSGGLVGIAVSGQNSVHLESVVVESTNTAITLYGGASLSTHSSEFTGQSSGLILRGGSEARVSDSTFLDGGIALMPGSVLQMTHSMVRGCDGPGILLQGDSRLHLEGCLIVENEGFGVLGYSAECAGFGPLHADSEHVFTGSMTGVGNTIPSPDEDHGNGKGDICPDVYRFLKEPSQKLVHAGGSIQAAIDASAEGASVVILEGAYRENLLIEKDITLCGEGKVVLMADSGVAPVIHVSGTSGVELQDLELEGAVGVEVQGVSCQLSNCVFRTSDIGVRGTVLGSNAIGLIRCAFSGDDAGVQLLGDGSAEIDECRFSNLSVGTMIGGTMSATIRRASFQDCYEGVVLTSTAVATIEDSRFQGCVLTGIRVSRAPLGSVDGVLTMNANVFSDGSGWAVSLCGLGGAGELEFLGTLGGVGNVVDGGVERLCPVDYGWPEGFLSESP